MKPQIQGWKHDILRLRGGLGLFMTFPYFSCLHLILLLTVCNMFALPPLGLAMRETAASSLRDQGLPQWQQLLS